RGLHLALPEAPLRQPAGDVGRRSSHRPGSAGAQDDPFRKSSGLVDAPGRRVGGAKAENPHCRPYLRARSRTSPRPWPLWRSTRSTGSARTRWLRSGALMVPRSPRRPAAWVANRYPTSSGVWDGAGRCPRSRTSARALAARKFAQGAVLSVTEEGPLSNAQPARGFLLAAALVTALPAAGAVLRFPGGAPCNTTVQACIDG